MKIEAIGLCVQSGRHAILRDVTLDIGDGGIFVVMGPNGAGKTTLLYAMAMLAKPSAGEIRYDGRPASRLGARQKTQIRRRLGFVFQQPLLLAGTVADNVRFGPRLRGRALSAAGLEAALAAVGLAAKQRLDVRLLSGGEKQRLQLARAMLLDPEVLLADEPTSNLDPLSTRFIEERLAAMAKAGKTVILTTHHLLQAHLLASRIFFMKAGRILQQGTAREVMASPVSLEVAHFSPFTNVLYGRMESRDGETCLRVGGTLLSVADPLRAGDLAAVLRPEDLIVSAAPIRSSARNCLPGRVAALEDMGMVCVIGVDCGDFTLKASITRESLAEMALRPGSPVYLTFKATALHLLPAE